MARQPGVALLMIASGSQIKLEFETLKAQYFSRKLYNMLNVFMRHGLAGPNVAEGEKKNTPPNWLKRFLFRPDMRPMRLVISVPSMTCRRIAEFISTNHAPPQSISPCAGQPDMLPLEHRAELSRAKLYRKIRGNTNHPLHATINRRQRNGWTTEIQECHRLALTQLEEPTQQQRDDTAPWEQLPYTCRIDWTREETEILKQISLEYIRSQTRQQHVLYRRFK